MAENPLVVIKVTLEALKKARPCSSDEIRSGKNNISKPICDASPAIVAPVAIWDGKYTVVTK
jgi:hypothetical protein